MKKISYLWAAVFLGTVCKAQFFYNEDEQRPASRDPIPVDNTYGYENPPVTHQQRPHSENYQSAPPAPPAAVSEYEQRPQTNSIRRRGSGYTQRQTVQLQPPPRAYAPSVFQNLALGMPPAGVSIPSNSFLNVLRNDEHNTRAVHNPVYEPAPPQPSPFVQSPAARSFFGPAIVSAPRPSEPASPPRVQTVEAPSTGFYRQPQIQSPQPKPIRNREQYPAPPAPAQYQAPPAPAQYQAPPAPEQYQAPPAPAPAPLQPQPQRISRRRSSTRQRSWSSSDEEIQQPPRVFSPSVFEKLSLGVAPSGIHVPDDSFLNILRSDRSNFRARRNQDYQPSSEVAPQNDEDYQPATQTAPENEAYYPAPRTAPRSQAYQPAPPAAPRTQVYQPAPPPAPRTRAYQPAPQPPAPRTETYRPAPQPPPRTQARQPAPQPPPRTQARQPAPPPARVAQRAPAQYSNEPTNFEIPQAIENAQPSPRRAHRQSQGQRHQQEIVDNSAYYQDADDQPKVVQQPKPVQSRRRTTVRRQRQNSVSISSTDSDPEELDQPPIQYGPSIFESLKLGEAPEGIHVPDDSFLNLLRGVKPVSRSTQSQVNQRPRTPAAAAPPQPRRSTLDVSEVQNSPSSDYSSQDVGYDRQDRRSRMSYSDPPQQQQNVPLQVYKLADIQPQSEFRKPAPQADHRPAVVTRPPQPPKRQRQRNRSQSVSLPQPQPVREVSRELYGVDPSVPQEDDILRHRVRDNVQRTRYQGQTPQHKRIDAVPPPQPVYEAPQPVYETSQPNYNDNPYFLEDEDLPRRRPQPTPQRRTQVQQQSVQRQRTDYQSRPSQRQRTRDDSESREQPRLKAANLSVKPLPDDVDGDQIPGEAGVDYPTLHVIPRTTFSCSQQAHNGYYADLETSCQVVHMCQAGGVQSSFLCPNGTIFNQEKFSCQWWYKVNCADAPNYYDVNEKLYKVPPPERRNKK